MTIQSQKHIVSTCDVDPTDQHGRLLHDMHGRVHEDAVGHLVGLQAWVHVEQVGRRHLLHNHRREDGRVIQLEADTDKKREEEHCEMMKMEEGSGELAVSARTSVYRQ